MPNNRARLMRLVWLLALLIVIMIISTIHSYAEDSVNEARETLGITIETVTGNNADNYYHFDDRYNGREASNNGFWSELQMPLFSAKNAYNNSNSTVEELKSANSMLSEAISKLIPSTCINPTSLYESYQIEIAESRSKSDYSTNSWSNYLDALDEAKNWIEAGLFDENGVLLPIEDQHYLDEVESALKNASSSLDYKASMERQADSKLALTGIRLYANTLFDVSKLGRNNYTSESWESFITARNDAIAFLDKAATYNGMGIKEVENNERAFASFRKACYSLMPVSETISVSVCTTDNYDIRNDKDTIKTVTDVIDVNSGTTVSDILGESGFITTDNYDSSLLVYLNGILLTVDANAMANKPLSAKDNYKDYIVQDGDVITASYTRIPTYLTPSGVGREPYLLNDVSRYMRYSTLSVDNKEKTEGQGFTVNVSNDGCLPINYKGTSTPVSGMTIYVSEPYDSLEEAENANITISTGCITDDEGDAEIKLYVSGWYAINAYDMREADSFTDHGGLINGNSILVYIGETDDLSRIKEELTEELENASSLYPAEYYSSEDWTTVSGLRDTALAEIAEAGSSREALTAQREALSQIIDIQENATSSNTEGLYWFRLKLGRLPDDLDIIDETYQSAISDLTLDYSKLNSWQLEQLSDSEIEWYEQIVEYAEKGLKEAVIYSVDFRTRFDTSVDTEAQNAILDMTEWLGNYEGLDDPDNIDGSQVGIPQYGRFYTINSLGGFRSTLLEDSINEATAATSKLVVVVDPSVTAYFAIRDGRLPSDRAWTIEDTLSFSGTPLVANGRVTVKINDEEYYIKNVEYTPEASLSYYDSWIRLCLNQNRLIFPNAYLSFSYTNGYEIKEDVSVTVTWAKVGAVSTETILQDLTNAFNGYVRGDYTDDDYSRLTAEFERGVNAVKTAVDQNAAEEAKLAALDAMAAIEKKPGGLLGSVTVTISNNTCSTGAFYDETGPFVSETIELTDTDSMMTVILKALDMNDFSWNGGTKDYGISYLASVSRGTDTLGEFDGGSDSGWMGTLNNWFTNLGFDQFSLENGGLKNGDRIDVMYTCALGTDIGAGMQGITNTVMGSITMTNGTLSPSFDGSITDYIFVLNDGAVTSTINFEPVYRSFQSRGYKDKYEPDAINYIASGDTIALSPGDTLYIGSGDPSWPSMSGNDHLGFDASVYKIKVVSISSVDDVIEMVRKLSSVKYSNYEKVRGSVENARTAYDALSDEAKAEVDDVLLDKLIAAEQLIAEYTALDEFKEALAEVDATSVADETAVALVETYEGMTDNQIRNLTTAEKNKVDSLRYAVSYEWSEDHSTCTASAVDRFDPSDVYSETVEASVTVIREATCTREGRNKYTAVFEDSRFKTQTVKVTMPLLGHKYGEPSYTWAEDNSGATAAFTCASCGDQQVVEASVTTAVTDSTCTEAGETVYTASVDFGGRVYTDTKTVVIEAKGHVWDEGKVTSEATVDAEGVMTYTCTVCGATREESIPKVEPVEPPVDPAKQMGEDGTAFGKGASLAATEKALASMKSDADPKGTVYRKLKLKQAKAAKTSIKVKWTKVSGAAKYAVYAAKCGKSNKFKKVTTTKNGAYTVKKINKKALKKGTYYKFIVVALDKKGNVVSTSKIVHIATTGGKAGNHKAVTTKAKNNKVSLKVKKTFKLGAKVTAASAKLKVKSHRKLKYESSNTKIATVSSKGLIKAKKKGTCYVYVYAQNGMAKKIKVIVG